MHIKINGKPEETQESTIMGLLKSKDIEPRMVSVELNAKMLDRSSLELTPVHEGDEIEFLYFMGGGATFS